MFIHLAVPFREKEVVSLCHLGNWDTYASAWIWLWILDLRHSSNFPFRGPQWHLWLQPVSCCCHWFTLLMLLAPCSVFQPYCLTPAWGDCTPPTFNFLSINSFPTTLQTEPWLLLQKPAGVRRISVCFMGMWSEMHSLKNLQICSKNKRMLFYILVVLFHMYQSILQNGQHCLHLCLIYSRLDGHYRMVRLWPPGTEQEYRDWTGCWNRYILSVSGKYSNMGWILCIHPK